MKTRLVALLLLCVCALLATAALAATPEPATLCGSAVHKWVCSYATPSSKPAGWYTPASAIPAGKTIYKSCTITQSCAGAICWDNPPVYNVRANHVNDIVLSSGARRAYCGTDASHASAFYTFP